jgi:Flp pilus assembly protein TadD
VNTSSSSSPLRLIYNVGRAAVLGVAVAGGLVCAATLSGCAAASNAELLTYSQQARTKGLKQFEAGDYQASAGSFRSATRQDPRDYKSFYYLGASYDQIGSHQQAAQAFQAGLKVMDVTLEGRSDKAFRAKMIDGLAIAFAKGTDRTASVTMPQPGKRPAEDAWLKAKVYRHTGDADAAIEAYTQASLQDPNDFYIAKDFGLYLTELGQRQQADAQLRRAYRLNSQDKEITQALARVGTPIGPGLKQRNELAKTPIPRGPLPELQIPPFGGDAGGTGASPAAAPAPSGAPAPAPTAAPAPAARETYAPAPGSSTVEAPRD